MITNIVDPSHVRQARRVAGNFARGAGGDEEQVGRIAIGATEMATNIVKLAGGAGGMIVLLDLNMPAMDGYQFLQRLSAEADIPAIVLASMILDNDQRKRLRRAAKIVSKSDLSSPVLTAAISGVLAKAELPA